MDIPTESILKADQAMQFVCDDLKAAAAEVDPVSEIIVSDLLQEAVSLWARISRLREARKARDKVPT